MSLPSVQPDAACNSVASGADASGTIAEAVAAGDSRAPRGQMTLLERSLTDENGVRAALLREEHAVRLQMMQELHQRNRGELGRKKAFHEEMYKLQHQQHEKNKFEEQVKALELETKQLKVEILQAEKLMKLEQLRRVRESP
ncbi:hypothetical protein V5799_017184 [Amblyomma americanum]|uniref:Uncharacterized protein n=1 Tax=Amblyomma americanum TaxID=6943 RepID=A0AAQ4F401_AMBAM